MSKNIFDGIVAEDIIRLMLEHNDKAVNQKISEGNIIFWIEKTREFLETNPVCSCCGEELTNFSRVMMCWRCRCSTTYQAFLDRNPGYQKQYQRERWIKLKQNNGNKKRRQHA